MNEIKPDAEHIAGLDFLPACDTRFGMSGGGTPCDLPARWSARIVCCGSVKVLCDRCIADNDPTHSKNCRACGAWNDRTPARFVSVSPL